MFHQNRFTNTSKNYQTYGIDLAIDILAYEFPDLLKHYSFDWKFFA